MTVTHWAVRQRVPFERGGSLRAGNSLYNSFIDIRPITG